MRKTTPASEGYYLPEDAHLQLLQTRNHLRMLAQMVAPRRHSDDNPDDLPLQPSALSDCFQKMGEQLNQVLEAMEWKG